MIRSAPLPALGAMALLVCVSSAQDANPLDSGGPVVSSGLEIQSTAAVLTGYDDRTNWATAAGGSPTLVDFDSLADGTLVTGTGALVPFGVDDTSGSSVHNGGAVDQFVYCSCTLNFPMFVAGTLPSEPNYFANNRNAPGFATGEFILEFTNLTTACGAFVADQSPLGNFTIEVFDSGGVSMGAINVPPRTLPDSFVGVVSTVPFKSAAFRSDSQDDSWGIDDLEHVASGLGTKYCLANANSTGNPADIAASGSASSAAGNLTLTSAPVPDQNGVFFHGANQINVPFGNGFLCTGGGTVRGAVVAASGNSSSYTYDNSGAKRDLSAFIGTNRNFQHWTRDPMGGGALHNTSNAISIDILP